MAPIKTNWTRLIRFVASETSQVHFGQPTDPFVDVGLAAATKKPIKAFEILGSPLDPAAIVTKRVLTVKELLSPLSREQIGTKPPVPIMFFKPTTALIGPTAPILIPRAAQPVKDNIPDYEVEFTVIIGRPMKDVPEEKALDYVLGYTVSNDTSFRYHQTSSSQWGFSKGFDDATPVGPCIVAAHTIKDPQNIPLKSILNGKVMQNGTTRDQIFSVAATLAYLSKGTTLLPGSIVLTGTPAGVGFARSPPVYLKDGDEIQVWVGEGVGTCINKVVEEGKAKL